MSLRRPCSAQTGSKKVGSTECGICRNMMSPVMVGKGLMGFECQNCYASSSDEGNDECYYSPHAATFSSVYRRRRHNPCTEKNCTYELSAHSKDQVAYPPVQSYQKMDNESPRLSFNSDSDGSCRSFQSISHQPQDGAGDRRKTENIQGSVNDPANFNRRLAALSLEVSKKPVTVSRSTGINWFIQAIHKRRYDQLLTLLCLILVLLTVLASTAEVILVDHKFRTLEDRLSFQESVASLISKAEQVRMKSEAFQVMTKENLEEIHRDTTELRRLVEPSGFLAVAWHHFLAYFFEK